MKCSLVVLNLEAAFYLNSQIFLSSCKFSIVGSRQPKPPPYYKSNTPIALNFPQKWDRLVYNPYSLLFHT